MSPRQEATFRDAVEDLADGKKSVWRPAYRVLRQGLPGSRPILHEALRHRSRRVRRLVVKLLGEAGKAEEDVQAVSRLLYDADAHVRLAAVFALRHLGPAGVGAMLRYVRREPLENLRKAAVKTLERWDDGSVVAPLVDLMQVEKDSGVRKFIAQALARYLKVDYGDDPATWKRRREKTSGEAGTRRAGLLRDVTDEGEGSSSKAQESP